MQLDEVTLKIIATSISLAAFCVGFARLIVALRPIWIEKRQQRILSKEFGRGPFDEATIQRSTRYYIRPKYTNVDPTQEEEARHVLVTARQDLFRAVDKLLDADSPRRHILLLADSGMGKTSFALNYYAYNQRRRKRRRHRLAIVPLGARNADELIADLKDTRDTVLFLDALDEDAKAIQDHRARIRTLMENCREFKRIIVTCRTQFFPKAEEIPVETGIVKLAPRKAGETHTYEFWKLYLAPFDDDDIKQYLKKRYPIWAYRTRKQARQMVEKIPYLSVRPMLLAHIPDLVASGQEITSASQLYEAMVNAWVEREAAWVDKEALRKFSEKLAVDLYVNRQARRMERISREELHRLAEQWGARLPEWKLTGRSLLNRDAEGNWKFAHRSIMEYLFVRRLVGGEDACYGPVLTDQMLRFLEEVLPGLTGHARRAFFEHYLSTLDGLVRDDEQLVALLAWMARKAATVASPYESSALRSYYLTRDLDLRRDHIPARAHACALALDLALDIDHDLPDDLPSDLALDLDLDLDRPLALALDFDRDCALAIDHARRLCRKLGLDGLHQALSDLVIPPQDASTEMWRSLAEGLQAIMIEHRDIGHEWNLCVQQWEVLRSYLYATVLLVRCLDFAYGIDRIAMVNRLLLPPAPNVLPTLTYTASPEQD